MVQEGLLACAKGRRVESGGVGSVVNGREEAKRYSGSDKPWRAQSGRVEKNKTALPVATLFPEKEVADFLPGVQGGMGLAI